jgi:hypothetical protein
VLFCIYSCWYWFFFSLCFFPFFFFLGQHLCCARHRLAARFAGVLPAAECESRLRQQRQRRR